MSKLLSGGGTMRHVIRLSAAIAALATALLGAPAVLANADEGGHHAVFVQTNDLNGNSIAASSRSENGSLTYAATYPTGVNGGLPTGVSAVARSGGLHTRRPAPRHHDEGQQRRFG